MSSAAMMKAWERRRERAARATGWERRRRELGLYSIDSANYERLIDREKLAPMLGLSLRTLQRYEFWDAPAWYELALEGLAARLKSGKVSRKQKA